MRFNTALLHQVEKGDKETGATLTPIYHSSAFYQSSAEQHEKLFHNKANGFSYTRINNPTILAFENEMTALDNKFFEEYKKLESACNGIYSSKRGVSEYINDMERYSAARNSGCFRLGKGL